MKRGVLILALASILPAAPTLAQTPRTISAVAPAPVYKGKRLYSNSWAVIIGINRYKSPKIPRLQYAEADAKAVRNSLIRLGFRRKNIRLLLGRKATRREVQRVLEEDLNPRMGDGDRLFIYFSGHGATTRVHQKQAGYLLAYDSIVYDWPAPGQPYMKRPPARALDMRTLMASVENLLPRHKLVAIDACFSGYAARSKSIQAVGLTPRRLERWLREPVLQVLTAGRAGQEAMEMGAYGHGVFTWYLLKGLAGNADEAGGGPDGLLSFDELAAYVRNRVSREPGVEQDPQAGEIGEGQFFFVLKGAAGDDKAERLRQERAKLQEERRKLEAEKARLERERLEAERKKLKAERRRIEEEKKRLAALQKNVGAGLRTRPPQPPRVAVGPGTPHEIGKGLDTMVLVPAGWFIMGSDSGSHDEKPQRRVYLDAFYMDKYPVTNSQFRKYGKPVRDYGESFKEDRQPVVGINWYQARDYCKQLRKRLPTEAKWEKAARGPEGRKYPWGNEWDPTRIIWRGNSQSRTHPVDRSISTHRSPYGALDMVGNVWEWVLDWYQKDFDSKSARRNPKGSPTGRAKVLRGSSWNQRKMSTLSATARNWNLPKAASDEIGFRCSRSADFQRPIR